MDPAENLPTGVESAFFDALELSQPDRARAIDDLCARWPEHADKLRARAKRPWTTTEARGGPSATTIGPYRILEAIAEGGMGVVYAADQVHPVQRRVAIKVIKPGMDSREVLARFEQERQALALMNHPHIAKVLEAGTTPEGRPFFAMEYVAGLPITTFVDKYRLTMRERLELFAQVCDGVQHAHQKGVIHRDIKPSNILVMLQDGKPHAKIIDFGVAKATQQRLTDKTVYTHQGQIVGTPEYMSPEQAEMTGVAIDTRSDIYSLGVLLYELLTGALPFDREAFRRADFAGMLKILREQEPTRPSTRVTTLGAAGAQMATQRRTDISGLRRLLRGDLDWITIKALEKDPARRYQSAGEFGADILRHLRDEPVSAGPPTLAYRLLKLARRHRGAIVAAGAVATSVLAGLVVSLLLLMEARAAHAREQAALRESQRLVGELARMAKIEGDQMTQQLIDGLDTLWPARPERVDALRAWIEQAETTRRTKAEGEGAEPEPARLRRESIVAVLTESLQRARARLAVAESIQRATIEQPAVAWRQAQARLASDARFAGITLRPEIGLVPLGADPHTGLLEFAQYGSGSIPKRRTDGSLDLANDFAIVLVLMPPAQQTWLGAQRHDQSKPNHDPAANPDEPEARPIDVAAFLIAKCELTQAQWHALSEGQLPSTYPATDHPVETVDQATAIEVLAHHGLALPDETRWEYAYRAGTTTPWYTGATRESLRGDPVAANIADITLLERGAPRDRYDVWEEYDDDMPVHGVVGRLRPNAFGLHDMIGNVFEFCILGDGPHAPEQPAVARGGAWSRNANAGRATARIEIGAKGTRFDNLGLRPLRPLQ